MSKEMTTIVLGIVVVVTPYLGIPGSWKVAIFVLAGLAIAFIGFLLRGEALERGARHSFTPAREDSMPFVESTQPRNDTERLTSLN